MRLVFVSTIAILFGCSAGFAQAPMSTPGAPAMVTSPLGMGATVGPTGIPLGATELNNGGLSPAPVAPVTSGTNCFASVFGTGPAIGMTATTGPAGLSGIGTPSLNSTFDGGGSAGLSGGVPVPAGTPSLSLTGSGSNTGCVSVPTGSTAAGTASPLSTPGNPGLTTLNGGVIPLGATELGSTGVSPLIPVPGVTSTDTPCAGTSPVTGTAGLTMPGSTSATGTTSMFGC